MALALGITESQTKNQSPKVAPAAAPDRDLGRGTRRQSDEVVTRAPDVEPEPRPAPASAPAPDGPPRIEPMRARPRDESRDLSDADRYRQSQAARAVSVYEAVQTADRRLPAGSGSIDGHV
ncbi:MAG: hypothetical protein U1E97_03940 [Alphaproteobacteria bacterium]